MGKKYLADAVALDSVWLRRIRGKLTDAEVLRAKELADEDIKLWIRQLFGSQSDDKETLEVIPVSDTDDTPLDIATIVLEDLFHLDGSDELDRLTHPDYVRFVDIAELIASYYLMQWGDFMGDADQAEGSPQQRAVNAQIRRMKIEVERLASLTTTTDADGGAVRYYFQRFTVLNNAGFMVRRKVRR